MKFNRLERWALRKAGILKEKDTPTVEQTAAPQTPSVESPPVPTKEEKKPVEWAGMYDLEIPGSREWCQMLAADLMGHFLDQPPRLWPRLHTLIDRLKQQGVTEEKFLDDSLTYLQQMIREGAVPSSEAIFKEMPENPKGEIEELFRRVRTDSYEQN